MYASKVVSQIRSAQVQRAQPSQVHLPSSKGLKATQVHPNTAPHHSTGQRCWNNKPTICRTPPSVIPKPPGSKGTSSGITNPTIPHAATGFLPFFLLRPKTLKIQSVHIKPLILLTSPETTRGIFNSCSKRHSGMHTAVNSKGRRCKVTFKKLRPPILLFFLSLCVCVSRYRHHLHLP